MKAIRSLQQQSFYIVLYFQGKTFDKKSFNYFWLKTINKLKVVYPKYSQNIFFMMKSENNLKMLNNPFTCASKRKGFITKVMFVAGVAPHWKHLS